MTTQGRFNTRFEVQSGRDDHPLTRPALVLVALVVGAPGLAGCSGGAGDVFGDGGAGSGTDLGFLQIADSGPTSCPESAQPCIAGERVPCETGLDGVCAVGHRTCNDDGCGYGECLQDTEASAEVGCDGFDNDCNGETDELAAASGEVAVWAKGTSADGGWPAMELWLRAKDGGAWSHSGSYSVASSDWTRYAFTVQNVASYDQLAIRFANDLATETEDRNLYVDRVQLWDNRTLSIADALYYNRDRAASEMEAPSLSDLHDIISADPDGEMLFQGALHFNLLCEAPPPTEYDVVFTIAVDDLYDLWLDGEPIAQDIPDWRTAEIYGPTWGEAAAKLSSGRHVIAVHARDDPVHGVWAGMAAHLKVDQEAPSFATGPIGSGWFVAPPGAPPADSSWTEIDFAQTDWEQNQLCADGTWEPIDGVPNSYPTELGDAGWVWKQTICAIDYGTVPLEDRVPVSAYFRLEFVLP